MSGLEILGAVASIAQLFDSANRARSCILDICMNASDVSGSLQALWDQTDSILKLLKSLDSDSPTDSRLAQHCVHECILLQSLVQRLQVATHFDGRLAKIRQAALWKIKEKEVFGALRKIERNVMVLNLHVSCQTHAVVSMLSSNNQEQNMLTERKSSNLPPRNWHFIGQERQLKELRQKLSRPSSSTHYIAVVGLGGIGKTELVTEYAHQIHADESATLVFFVRGQSEFQLELDYGSLLSRMTLVHGDPPLTERCRRVKNILELEPAGHWLMIIDGVDDAAILFGSRQLYQILPQGERGRVVFTCRNFQLALKLVRSPENILHMTRLDAVDALQLLRSRIEGSKYEDGPSLELVDLLEGLPLALSQAAAFIATNFTNIPEYLGLFKSSEGNRIELLSENSLTPDQDASTVGKTWLVSFQSIEKADPVAARFMKIGSCLWRQQISVEFLKARDTAIQVKKALGLLQAYSLITFDDRYDMIEMHPLVHLCLRNWLRSQNQLERYAEVALNVVFDQFPKTPERLADILEFGNYSLHTQFVLENPSPQKCQVRRSELASRLSCCLRRAGEYRRYLQYAKVAVESSSLGRADLDPANLIVLNDLALAHWHLGQLEAAETLARDVLDKRRNVLGLKHRDTLASLNNLGLIVHDRGDYQSAEGIHREACETRLEVFGPRDNDVMKSRNNLGLSLKRQEKYAEAEETLHQVLMERRELLGCCHMDTVSTMSNLALVLQEVGRLEDALALHLEVQRARDAFLGTEHPDSLKSRQNVAVVLLKMDRKEEARVMMEHAVTQNSRIVGDEHPNTLYAQLGLAAVLRSQRQYSAAKSLASQVLETKKRTLGKLHPETLYSERLLGEIVKEEGVAYGSD